MHESAQRNELEKRHLSRPHINKCLIWKFWHCFQLFGWSSQTSYPWYLEKCERSPEGMRFIALPTNGDIFVMRELSRAKEWSGVWWSKVGCELERYTCRILGRYLRQLPRKVVKSLDMPLDFHPRAVLNDNGAMHLQVYLHQRAGHDKVKYIL